MNIESSVVGGRIGPVALGVIPFKQELTGPFLLIQLVEVDGRLGSTRKRRQITP